MKKIDTFYLSDKQIEQMKSLKKPNKNLAVAAVLLLISVASGISLGNLPAVFQSMGIQQLSTANLEMILTGITGFGGIGSVIAFAKSFKYKQPEIDPETRKELEEMGSVEDYPRRRNGV